MSALNLVSYKSVTRTLLPLLVTLVVSACGQKGPLYLPDQEKQQNPQNKPLEENNSEKRENL